MRNLRSFTWRAILFALIWLSLTGSDYASWIIGAPCVLGAAWLSVVIANPSGWEWSLRGWLRLVPFFLKGSIAGGWDVARRVLTPTIPVDPVFADYELRLPSGSARWFLVHLISLMPGTLSAEVNGSQLTIHALNGASSLNETIAETESIVSTAFKIDLES
ncbi:MAG: Na+/H+ antiporter subunit E [Verrucomicrobiota bacterium]